MDSSDFNFQIIHLLSVSSTNIYAHKLLQKENVKEGLVIHTEFQEKGKGQRESSWESDAGKNLMFSLLLKPNIKVETQFDLSMMIAISMKSFLDNLTVGKVEVKWPNDILINGKKVAGILIENILQGSNITSSIIGIGINVNQTEFNNYKRSATSLKLSSGKEWDIKELLTQLLEKIKSNYLQFKKSKVMLREKYLSALHGYGTPLKYEDKDGEFIGVVLGVLPNGRVQLNKNGKLKHYDLKELTFLE